MENILELAERNLKRANELINEIGIVDIWKSIGAEANLVGSVKTGLIMKKKDIDFHIYSSPLNVRESFLAMSILSENPSVKHMECANLMDTEEECVEWHVQYEDANKDMWKIDMIHIRKGSLYDGYMENVAERIIRLLTPETKQAILSLKYNTPDTESIMGIVYYQAVLRDRVRSWDEFTEWRKNNSTDGIINWIP